MSTQAPIKALNDREVNGVIVLLVSHLDVKCRNSCDEAAHSKVFRSSVFLLVEVSALLDSLNFKQLHICVIPDRGIHIPRRERQDLLYSLWPGTWNSNLAARITGAGYTECLQLCKKEYHWLRQRHLNG